AWAPGSAESTKVLNLSGAFQSPDVFPAVVVYERPAGLTPADQAKAAADVPKFARMDRVTKVTGPLADKHGEAPRAMQVLVQVNFGTDGWSKAPDVVDTIRHIATDGSNGLTIAITGPARYAADPRNAFKGIDGVLLYGALVVVIALLLITYRSPILWLLPVLSAVTALMSAEAVIYLLARHAGLTVNAQSAGILTVLVFGAGTDYALLLVARYREELRKHADRHEAMTEALHRAGPAIIASAATVAISMLILFVAQMNSTRGLGPVLAIGVGVGLLAMITLLPAILVICGRWLF